jgi:hypothetical protein
MTAKQNKRFRLCALSQPILYQFSKTKLFCIEINKPLKNPLRLYDYMKIQDGGDFPNGRPIKTSTLLTPFCIKTVKTLQANRLVYIMSIMTRTFSSKIKMADKFKMA